MLDATELRGLVANMAAFTEELDNKELASFCVALFQFTSAHPELRDDPDWNKAMGIACRASINRMSH